MDLPVSLSSGQSSENLERHSYAIFPDRGTTQRGTALMSRYVYVSLRFRHKGRTQDVARPHGGII